MKILRSVSCRKNKGNNEWKQNINFLTWGQVPRCSGPFLKFSSCKCNTEVDHRRHRTWDPWKRCRFPWRPKRWKRRTRAVQNRLRSGVCERIGWKQKANTLRHRDSTTVTLIQPAYWGDQFSQSEAIVHEFFERDSLRNVVEAVRRVECLVLLVLDNWWWQVVKTAQVCHISGVVANDERVDHALLRQQIVLNLLHTELDMQVKSRTRTPAWRWTQKYPWNLLSFLSLFFFQTRTPDTLSVTTNGKRTHQHTRISIRSKACDNWVRVSFALVEYLGF